MILQKKALILRSVGKPLHLAGCIIIGDMLVENMPWERLLEYSSVHKGSLKANFVSLEFLKASLFDITHLMGYSLIIIRIHPSPLIIDCLFFHNPGCAFEFVMCFSGQLVPSVFQLTLLHAD